mmetsp:Transcript_38945/g.48229  ORF Transcript_38945/g.48229 Transcript_38945/m.48229 type:complete len:231 (+) Transcript_38945:103-795(+)
MLRPARRQILRCLQGFRGGASFQLLLLPLFSLFPPLFQDCLAAAFLLFTWSDLLLGELLQELLGLIFVHFGFLVAPRNLRRGQGPVPGVPFGHRLFLGKEGVLKCFCRCHPLSRTQRQKPSQQLEETLRQTVLRVCRFPFLRSKEAPQEDTLISHLFVGLGAANLAGVVGLEQWQLVKVGPCLIRGLSHDLKDLLHVHRGVLVGVIQGAPEEGLPAPRLAQEDLCENAAH